MIWFGIFLFEKLKQSAGRARALAIVKAAAALVVVTLLLIIIMENTSDSVHVLPVPIT
jgi:hypothetical protein